MESQLTLVDSSLLAVTPRDPKLEATMTLQLERNCAHNTVIFVREEDPPVRYIVRSDAHASSTHVTKVIGTNDPVPVGVINRRSLLPDTIELGEFSMGLGKWLRTPMLSVLPAIFTIGERSFTWRQTNAGGLELKYEPTEATHPVAWVDRATVRTVDGSRTPRQPPAIYLRQEAEDIVDEVVLSFLVLEHRILAMERAKQTKTAAVGGSAGGLSMLAGH